MATRRMIAKQIVQSTAYITMSAEAKDLYVQLAVGSADDDGVCNNTSIVCRMLGYTQKVIDELAEKKFIIRFDGDISVIKHWRINNRLQNDRHKDSTYTFILQKLHVKPNKAYTLDESFPYAFPELFDNLTVLDTSCVHRLGKDSIGKDNKDSIGEKRESDSEKNEKLACGYYQNVFLTQEELDGIYKLYAKANTLIEKVSAYLHESGKEYNSHYKLIMKIAKEDGFEVIR